MKEEVHVFAPATVANVACGFDILGFALEQPGDEIIMRRTRQCGVVIRKIFGDNGKLSCEAGLNVAGIAASHFLNNVQPGYGVEIELQKGMPIGSGLGSSAASATASLFAANILFDKPLNIMALLPLAMECEKAVCGTAHADNVGPALLGGFTLIRSYEPLDVVAIKTPDDLLCTVIHPHIEVSTEDARKILRKQIALKDAITQWGNVAGLIAGLMKSDYELIGRSLRDVIAEPVRSLLIPRFKEIQTAVLACGALGCSISGSGPSIFALTNDQNIAEEVGRIAQGEFQSAGLRSEVFISGINQNGPVLIEEE
ncbi:MAG: homoserine kinase [Candidatus Fischerbacteria bacterium RBG_13_37_8]|uniref:Homoserine kinase n=1 Tax=Candidatus Fischerbacteria bacterium RBG_13_37_8 TaxID=1817863 RepID=A0A1F5VLS8_9BACT|nr:MAG: homoserine kinase [Candidatus Fischerbacteria bacterium RBG_13_37_8]